MILLVALIEPHYEINLWNKVYNEREIDCKVCLHPWGTTMCVNIVSEAKPTTMLYYNYNRFNNTSIITVSGNVVVIIYA